MTIPAIGALTGISSLVSGSATATTAATSAASSTGGADFASMLNNGLQSLQSSQTNADSLAVQASTGDLSDIAQYSIAATQASVATQLATTLTSKAVEAFNQIMGMQA
jgi:flagellar hook-basal body complex protein FliE